MTYTSSNGAFASDKCFSASSTASPIAIEAGLVRHPILTATDQVVVLRTIDRTGSATVGDVIVALADHIDPVGAIGAMIEAGVIVARIHNRVFDEHTLLTRAPTQDPDNQPDPNLAGAMLPPNGGPLAACLIAPLPDDIEFVAMSRLEPRILVGTGAARRTFANLEELRRPGVYILMSAESAYVGMGSSVGRRVASGNQPIQDVDAIVTITDAHDGLNETDVLALERILHTRVSTAREVSLINGTPDGAPIDPGRYRELELFAAAVCDGLARTGHLFVNLSPRMVLAGSRAETCHSTPQRSFNELPEGEIMELSFGKGLTALAARRTDEDWLLLRGSDIRLETVASANASASYLRAAWLHGGILQLGDDGQSYLLMRDVSFRSASAAMHFVVGSKGQGRGGWQPIDPIGGYDPQTSALIAA